MSGPVRIGVLGAGQLGRMLALAARPLGIGVVSIDPAEGAPAATVAEVWRGAYDDPALLGRMEDAAERITFEFENVPPSSLEALARRRPVWPSPEALIQGRDRLREKALFERMDLPVPAYRSVDGRAALDRAVGDLGGKAMVKTRYGGFDGRGQALLEGPIDDATWAALAHAPLLVETFVPFVRELSLIAVRGPDGTVAFYPLVENHHEQGVLRFSLAPAAGVEPARRTSIEAGVTRLLDHLGYVGVMALELFETRTGWLANEMAPRVHNSGHWTIEGAETSQFENHLRAGLGWPLGSTAACRPSVMLNLLGRLPEPETLLAVPGLHLHTYEKAARPSRKLGHVTLTAGDVDTLAVRLDLLAAAEPTLAAAALRAGARLRAG